MTAQVDGDLVAVRPPAFALFAEMLLIGAIVAVMSLPVVTFLPALAAGIGHLRRHAALRSDPLGQVVTEFVTHLRGVWRYAIALPLVLAVCGFNVLVLAVADLPGAQLVRWVSLALAAVVLVIVVRAATLKSADSLPWPDAVRSARRRLRTDVRGSVLLGVAVGLCGVVVWMLPILVVIVPGMLTLAAVAVEQRR